MKVALRFLEGESSWGPTYLPYNIAEMVALNIDKLIKRYQETRPFKLFAKWREWLDEESRLFKWFHKKIWSVYLYYKWSWTNIL